MSYKGVYSDQLITLNVYHGHGCGRPKRVYEPAATLCEVWYSAIVPALPSAINSENWQWDKDTDNTLRHSLLLSCLFGSLDEFDKKVEGRARNKWKF